MTDKKIEENLEIQAIKLAQKADTSANFALSRIADLEDKIAHAMEDRRKEMGELRKEITISFMKVGDELKNLNDKITCSQEKRNMIFMKIGGYTLIMLIGIIGFLFGKIMGWT
mgnify:CR=1 FL=1